MSAPSGVSVWHPMVIDVSRAEGVAWDLVSAMVWQESSGNPRAFRHEASFWDRYMSGKPEWTRGLSGLALAAWASRASSSYGLMQIMYPTACLHGLPMSVDPEVLFEPRRNLALGAKIIHSMLDTYDGDIEDALLHWNGGGNPTYAREVLRKREAVIPTSQGG